MERLNELEAILFISGKAVFFKELADFFKVSKEVIKEDIIELQNLKANTGVNIKIFEDDSVQVVTNPYYGKTVSNFFNPEAKPKKLTKAALETLAIIAYNQPVTKAFVEQIRGVDSAGVVGSLCQKGLVEERGRLELPGRPLLYGTTPNFLRCMGISTLEELPPLKPEEQPESVQAPARQPAEAVP